MDKEKLNTIVYIDYENVHYNLINGYKNIFECNFFNKLKKFLEDKGYSILDMIAYCNFDIKDMHDSFHQTKLHQFGIDTRHTTNNGKNYADIQITADVLEQVYSNKNLDCIIIISNDKDMTPLIKTARKVKDNVSLVLFKSNYDEVLLACPNQHFFIDDILEIKIDEVNGLKEEIKNNLSNYIQKDFIDQGKVPPCISLERYVESTVKWHKIFEYEVIRLLSLLEKEGDIVIHKYTIGSSNREHIGIITPEFEKYFQDPKPIHKINNYFAENKIMSYYNKFTQK
ncbi:TPA: NYN domain-containing protein [Bacillus cereus]|uniref:NYN domain-containing protein n=1 Tax=Bacillales TaxID=1385 RepID=UPI0008645AD4|nr:MULTISPECIES: NYN domain-containing protein [Bacillales]MCP1284731.1 NYN domain-containing protein [Bacillus sp. S0635]MCQ6348535.1 NYN domain-containing protein [Bacillus cereus]MCU5750345.1 NYN domain-containing protein [Bacillus cereus]SCM90824.1 Uncharacterized protein BCF24048_00215 [Bacillus cereus]HDX9630587.1 NYN domain-containing protein [Bacillus cereus]